MRKLVPAERELISKNFENVTGHINPDYGMRTSTII
jgi:hypothetical protein